MNVKAVVVALFIIVVTLSLVLPTLQVKAQVGSQIEQIFPSDKEGAVGQAVTVIGSIDTSGGKFEIYFDTVLVVTGTSQGNAVTAGFRIPEEPAGTYTITLRDVATNGNGTDSFTVNLSYSIVPNVPASPGQLQEGNVVALNVSVTGGQPNTPYSANITITLPAPLNTNYSRLVTLPTSNSKGTSTTQTNYPDSTFEPSGSTTDYAGTYNVYFNLTDSLTSNQFTVGFTDATQYHRGQTVKIRAINYQPNDTATVTIKNQASGASLHSADVTPTSNGTVTDEWSVPSNAAIGICSITVTARNTSKLVPDSQNITVPGYPITISVKDLSNRRVPQVLVEALDTATNTTYDGTSGDDGNATVNLESGRHNLAAYWNGLQVGETNITVTGAGEFGFQTELGDLRITVKDKNGLLIPSVNLDITYSYSTTKDNQRKTGNVVGQTNNDGVYTVNSTPPGITYIINASVYGLPFNSGNDTVNNLPVQAVSDVTIICPSRNLTFTITDYNHAPIANARLSLIEINAGIFYSITTDDNGVAMVDATFGRYTSRVYTGSVLLNETVVDAFTDKHVEIQCVLYNLQVNVKVVDFFGQSIPNANVRLTGPDGTVKSEQTQPDGRAVFNTVIGGDMQIVAYLNEGDDYFEAQNVHVESPTTVQVSMGRYILLGSFVLQTSVFVTVLIVVPVIVLFLVLEVYRRRKTKSKKPAVIAGKASSK